MYCWRLGFSDCVRSSSRTHTQRAWPEPGEKSILGTPAQSLCTPPLEKTQHRLQSYRLKQKYVTFGDLGILPFLVINTTASDLKNIYISCVIKLEFMQSLMFQTKCLDSSTGGKKTDLILIYVAILRFSFVSPLYFNFIIFFKQLDVFI